jgi:hypothetical protein
MSDTVLAHVLAPFSQKENLATEALAFIANKSPTAREAIRRRLSELVGDVPTIARIVTQLAVGEESRPDLVLLGEAGETIGFIEAKFWAALTAAQPVEYIRRLAAQGGVLVMLAPDQRLPTLRAEVIERCRQADLQLDIGAKTLGAANTRIGFLAWSTLLAALRDAVAEDSARASDVRQLAGLCDRFEHEGFIPLIREDIDDLEVPRRFMMLAGLVNDVIDTAAASGIVSLKGMRAVAQSYGPGRYFAFPRLMGWLGLNHSAWGRWGRSPLWMWFWTPEPDRARQLITALRPWMTAEPPLAFTADDGSPQVPLVLRTGVEKDALVDDALRQLRAIDELVAGAGMKPLKGEVPPEPRE